MVLPEGPNTVTSLVGTDVSVYDFLLTTRWPWNSDREKRSLSSPVWYSFEAGTNRYNANQCCSSGGRASAYLPTMSQALGLISSTA